MTHLSLVDIERRRVCATYYIFAACLTAFLAWIDLGSINVHIMARVFFLLQVLELKLLLLNCVSPVIWTYRIAPRNVRRMVLLRWRIVHFHLRWILRIWPAILVMLNVVLRLLRKVPELVSCIPDMQVVVSAVRSAVHLLLLLFAHWNRYLRVPLRRLGRRGVRRRFNKRSVRLMLTVRVRFLPRRSLTSSGCNCNPIWLFIFVRSCTGFLIALTRRVLRIRGRLVTSRLRCLLTKGTERVLVLLVSFLLLLRYLRNVRQYLASFFLLGLLLKSLLLTLDYFDIREQVLRTIVALILLQEAIEK